MNIFCVKTSDSIIFLLFLKFYLHFSSGFIFGTLIISYPVVPLSKFYSSVGICAKNFSFKMSHLTTFPLEFLIYSSTYYFLISKTTPSITFRELVLLLRHYIIYNNKLDFSPTRSFVTIQSLRRMRNITL